MLFGRHGKINSSVPQALRQSHEYVMNLRELQGSRANPHILTWRRLENALISLTS